MKEIENPMKKRRIVEQEEPEKHEKVEEKKLVNSNN